MNGKMVIVAGVMFDGTADAVWEAAHDLLSSRPDAVLHVCHVIKRDPMVAELEDASPYDAAFVELFSWVVSKTSSKDAPVCKQIHLQVAIGDPANEIVQSAVDVDADLILVGTHGRAAVGRLVLGSVAEGVMRKAPCSVLVARPLEKGRHKSPSIAPPPEPGHRAFHPHAAARRSVELMNFTAGMSSTTAVR